MRKLGAQTGANLWQHAHGIDNRQVELPKARRSIGADVNWGVRFSTDEDAHKFLKVGMSERGGGGAVECFLGVCLLRQPCPASVLVLAVKLVIRPTCF